MKTTMKCGFTALLMIVASVCAHAQATRTWVSGVGDDANPCSRTAPCKTFAGAISKTAAGGEISVLDPGGYGSVNITKALTINGDAILTGITNSGATGVIVNAGASDLVILKHLSIHAYSAPSNGILYQAGGRLIVEDCTVTGQSASALEITSSAAANLVVRNSVFSGGVTGIKIDTSANPVSVSLDRVSIRGFVNGVEAQTGNVDVSDSAVIQNSGSGLLASGGSIVAQNSAVTGNAFGVQAGNGGVLSLDKSTLFGNGIAVYAQSGSTIRLSANTIYNNQTGLGCGGGTIASTGDNKKGSNTGGSVAVCAPTVAITLQ